MYRFAVIPCLALSLTACGGASTSSNISYIQTYEEGTVALMRVRPANSDLVYVGIADIDAVEEAAAGSVAGLRENYSTWDGDWYTVGRTGVMSSGGAITFDTVGVNLNSSGSEYVARSLITTDTGTGYMVVGAPMKITPSGSHAYVGRTEVIEAGGGSASLERGDVTVNINFESNTGSITGVTPSYIYSSTDLKVDPQTGNFSSQTAEIGRRSGVKVDAIVTGSVYGTRGNGVGGVVNSDVDASGGFLGSFGAKE